MKTILCLIAAALISACGTTATSPVVIDASLTRRADLSNKLRPAGLLFRWRWRVIQGGCNDQPCACSAQACER
ncbi:hypothetical protein ACI3PL_22665, partial [Lacticaseibacillus paracasei]